MKIRFIALLIVLSLSTILMATPNQVRAESADDLSIVSDFEVYIRYRYNATFEEGAPPSRGDDYNYGEAWLTSSGIVTYNRGDTNTSSSQETTEVGYSEGVGNVELKNVEKSFGTVYYSDTLGSYFSTGPASRSVAGGMATLKTTAESGLSNYNDEVKSNVYYWQSEAIYDACLRIAETINADWTTGATIGSSNFTLLTAYGIFDAHEDSCNEILDPLSDNDEFTASDATATDVENAFEDATKDKFSGLIYSVYDDAIEPTDELEDMLFDNENVTSSKFSEISFISCGYFGWIGQYPYEPTSRSVNNDENGFSIPRLSRSALSPPGGRGDDDYQPYFAITTDVISSGNVSDSDYGVVVTLVTPFTGTVEVSFSWIWLLFLGAIALVGAVIWAKSKLSKRNAKDPKEIVKAMFSTIAIIATLIAGLLLYLGTRGFLSYMGWF